MPDKVSCVHCDRSYEVDFSKGTSIICFCGKLIRFPEMPSQPPDSHIRFSCPSCSKPYKVLVEKAGQKRICPSCSKPFTIPSHSTSTPNQDQHQQPNLKDHSNSGSKYPYLNLYCGFVRFCAYCFIGLCFIGFFLGLSKEDINLVIQSIQGFGLALGGLAFGGIIEVLMDIEENTRKN